MNCEVVEASKLHVQSITDVTNEAFVVDRFFKKPNYFNRFEVEDVEKLMTKENSLFLIATNESKEFSSYNGVVGSIFLHFDIDWTDESSVNVCLIVVIML